MSTPYSKGASRKGEHGTGDKKTVYHPWSGDTSQETDSTVQETTDEDPD